MLMKKTAKPVFVGTLFEGDQQHTFEVYTFYGKFDVYEKGNKTDVVATATSLSNAIRKYIADKRYKKILDKNPDAVINQPTYEHRAE